MTSNRPVRHRHILTFLCLAVVAAGALIWANAVSTVPTTSVPQAPVISQASDLNEVDSTLDELNPDTDNDQDLSSLESQLSEF